MFPTTRLRRRRYNPIFRGLLQENHLRKEDFIYPLFVAPGKNVRNVIESMPGVYQLSIDNILKECEECLNLGLNSIILFGIPEEKDSEGKVACKEDGIIQQALREIKKAFDKDILLVTDLCFCEYTSHGHCGTLNDHTVDNDKTISDLGIQALSHADAGADVIAPSGMMDGMIQAIRRALDVNDYVEIPIISYAVKYASAYYGPFRDVAESTPQQGDRKSYQMNPANALEALAEAWEDISEGADMLMVKPALAYMDIIREVKQRYGYPLAAYNVSGEYSMIKTAGKMGYIDEKRVTVETLLSMKRAGADVILTYHAKDVCQWLKEDSIAY